jgi:hypothetical protein
MLANADHMGCTGLNEFSFFFLATNGKDLLNMQAEQIKEAAKKGWGCPPISVHGLFAL